MGVLHGSIRVLYVRLRNTRARSVQQHPAGQPVVSLPAVHLGSRVAAWGVDTGT
jgi:hypothetical protein